MTAPDEQAIKDAVRMLGASANAEAIVHFIYFLAYMQGALDMAKAGVRATAPTTQEKP